MSRLTDRFKITTPNSDSIPEGIYNLYMSPSEKNFLVPSGGIIMWQGDELAIPTGWFLCDGLNGTPDLRGRFVVGSGGAYTQGATGGSANAVVVAHNHSASTGTSGWHGHTASTGTSGWHGHGASTNTTGWHGHSNSTNFSLVDGGSGETRVRAGSNSSGRYTAAGQISIDGNGNHSHTVSIDGSGNHTHTVSIDASGNHTHTVSVGVEGESGTGKNLPPYYALAYIMKS